MPPARLILQLRGPSGSRRWWLCLTLIAIVLAAQPLASADAGILARIDSLRVRYQADSAFAAIERALPAAGSQADSALLLALWVRQGELLTSLGRARAGEGVLRQALTSAGAAGDTATVCMALRWLAVAVGSQGRGEEAAALYQKLLTLAHQRLDPRHEGWALVGLAWEDVNRGRPGEAIERYRRATELFRASHDPRAEAWALDGLGTALTRAGRYEEAARSYRAAATRAQDAGYPLVAAYAANNLGTLEYTRGDPGVAADHFRRAVHLLRGMSNNRETVVPGINIALCEAELGHWSAAADSLRAMLALCRRETYRDLEAKALNPLAAIYLRQGRPREARACYRAALSLGNHAPLHDRIRATIGLAEALDCPDSSGVAEDLLIEAAAALPDENVPSLDLALAASLGGLRARCGRPQAALGPLRQADRIAADLGHQARRIAVLADLSRVYRDLGRPDSARGALELATRLWEAERGLPADPQWRESRGDSGRLLCNDLLALILGRDPGPEARREAYERAQAFKARTLLERMSGPVADSLVVHPGIRLADLQSVLREGELLLDFFLGPEQSYLFTVSRDSLWLEALPPEASIEPAARLFHDLLASPPSIPTAGDALRAAGEALGAKVLGAWRPRLATCRRLIVVPDGALNLIPHELLADESAHAAEWVRVPSAAVLARLRATGGRGAARSSCLVVADEAGPLGILRGAREEAEALARTYADVKLRLLGPADSLTLAELSSDCAVLHVACHAEADDQRPWLSTIRLGDSRLRAGAIAAARIPAGLAFLSSCQTAHGRVVSGEGVLGLSTALLSAGTECVVATLWPVEDRTTAKLVRAFYSELAAGRSVAGALGGAQRVIRENPATEHPFFWAGFVAIGAGETTVPLAGRRPPVPPGAMAALAAAALAGTGAWIWLRRGKTNRRVIRSAEEHLLE